MPNRENNDLIEELRDSKGRMVILWENPKPWETPAAVYLDSGDLTLRFAYAPSDEGTCCFSLFCEVGRPYQPWFDGFFAQHKLADKPHAMEHSPWLADRLAPHPSMGEIRRRMDEYFRTATPEQIAEDYRKANPHETDS